MTLLDFSSRPSQKAISDGFTDLTTPLCVSTEDWQVLMSTTMIRYDYNPTTVALVSFSIIAIRSSQFECE